MAGIISNKYTGTDAASPLSWGLVVKEVDGIPTVGNVNTIIVSNGTLTDNGGGVVTILTSGGGGGGAPSGPQYAVQLNDGAGNFIGSANYTYDYTAFELTVNGKIIMNNIIEDTTGIDFDPVAVNPGTTAAETLWSNSSDANNLYYGSNAVLNDASIFNLFDVEDDTASTTTIARFDTLELSGGTGISTLLSAGPEITITNEGVTSIVAGAGISVSGATGAVTITSTTAGTVTSVATANSTFVSLAGGPITTTGTLTASLSATGTADATTFLRGDNTWAVPGSGLTTFTVSGDGGIPQTIADGDNLQILGSTAAGSGADLAGVLDTVAAAGDLLYVETRAMTGATGVADGATGFAPKALTGEQEYYLAGDATWKVLPVSYSWIVSDGTTTDTISDGDTVQFAGTATQLVATVSAGAPSLVTYALVNVNTSGSGSYAYPSNITVDLQGRITAITAGGGPGSGTVTSITFEDGGGNSDTITTAGTIEIVGGTAIDSTLNPATGVFTITNTGVNSLANVGGTYAGTGASYVIPSAATGSGIDLELTTTGVAAGSYSATNLTVDAYGRLTAASDGSASIVNTKFYIEDDAANNELVSTNDTILLKEGLGGMSVVVSNPDTVTFGLDTTGVAAGSYIAADITVDAYGRLSAASQGTQFSGGANVGIVPTAAAAANNTYLEKDGTWTDPLAGLAAGDGITFAAPTISVNLTANTGLQFNGGTTALEGTVFTTANIGMVPAPGAINNFFLRDDGTWVAVGGSGTVTSVATANSTFVDLSGGPITTTGTLTASLSASGTASAGTFLRGDNTWATPAGGFASFDIASLPVSITETINSLDTITFAGGTALTGVITATDTVTFSLDDTVVTPGSYTYGSFTVDQQGRLTAASSGAAPGTMSSWILTGDSGTETVVDGDTVDIAGGTGITTAASATDTLTVTLDDTAVTPGSYTYTAITVDQQGRLTAASSGTPPSTFTFDAAGSSGTPQAISSGDTLTIAQGTGITSVASATDTITITNTLPFNNLLLAGDSGSETISDGDTITIAGGTAITTAAAATDTVTITLDNTAVSAGSYTYASITVDQQGRLTAASSGSSPGTMSDFIISDGVTTETVVDGDTIIFTGGTALTSAVSATDTVTFSLDNTAVTPGSYTYATLTVDAQGRLTAASSGAAPGTMDDFIVTADSGTPQTIADADTLTIAGGTALSSVASATDTVTLNLDNTAVAAGSYTNTSLTVDAQGRLTAASSGAAPGTMSDFIISDGVTTETVTDGDTITFADGTFINQTVTATDTVTSDLSATGTPGVGTFLRGDNTWATPAGGFSNFSIATSPVTLTETINSGDTITFVGGTALTSAVSATDTVTFSLDNTAVTPGSYTYSSITVDAQGRLTSASSGSAPGTMSTWTLSGDGGVNQTISDSDTVDIAGGTGITTTASATDTLTVTLDDTAVTPGSYTYSSITVDQQGRLTAASSGAAPGTMSSFTLDGSSGPTQTINDGDTLIIAQGTGITSVASATDTITITNTGVTSIAATTPINASAATGSVTISSDAYTGGAGIGYVPSGGSAADFLRGDGTWATPGGSFTFDVTGSSGTTETISSGDTLTIAQGTGITSVSSAADTITITNTLPFNSLTLAGDSGTQTISDGDTITIAGGTAITTVAAATDTVTVTLDDTAVTPATYTYSTITVDQQGRITSAASGSAPGTMSDFIISDGVTTETVANGDTITFTGGTALTSVVSATDTVTFNLDNTAVTPGSYTYGSFTVDAQGRLTAASSGAAPGTMNSWTLSGDGGVNQTISDSDTVDIAGGTAITTTASAIDTLTVDLDDTAVTPGSYTYTAITVDQQGRLTAASSGTPPSSFTFDVEGSSGTTESISSGDTLIIAQGTGITSVSSNPDTVTITNTLPFNSLALAGDTGPNQTISDGDTITVAGGTALSSVASATDTVTINLDNTAVTPASYTYASITVDAQGRLTAASSGAAPGTMSDFIIAGDSGTETVVDGDTITFAGGTALTSAVTATDTVTFNLDDTAVTPASYTYASITVDQQGRLTAASSGASPGTMDDFLLAGDTGPNQTISDGNTLTVAGGTALSSVASATDTVTLNLDNTAVVAASYGDATNVPAFTVDAQGRLTAAADVAITFPFSSFDIATTPATATQTISDTDTLTFASGTFITQTVAATDTVTGDLSATGTPSATTFLRGDNTWASPAGSFTFDVTGSSGTTETISSGDTLTIAQGTGITAVSSNPDTVTITNSLPFNSLTLAGDSGSETVVDGDTITIAGGTGLTTAAAATDTVTVTLDNTAVTPGSYTYSSITVDAQGRLTAASSGSSPGTMDDFIISDGVTTQTIADGDTLLFSAGTGITAAVTATDTLTITNTGVTSAVAGTGISVSGATGAVTIGNTGVTSIVAGTNVSISGATGAVTINSTDQYTGTVTSVDTAAGTFISGSGGPITTTGSLTYDLSATGTPSATTFLRGDNTWGTPAGSFSDFILAGDSGTQTIADGDTLTIAGGTGLTSVVAATDTATINLDDTAVTPASYGDATNVASFTVDQQGRLTAAADVAITFPTVVTSVTGTTPINVSAATGAVTISSDAYAGTTNVGYVPTGGSATTYLRGDGTWADPGAEFSFDVAADSGAGFTVDDGDTVTVTAGTTGLSFAAATDTITLSGTLDVDNGGTGATTLTDGGILLGSGTSAITATAQPIDGQLLVGYTGADPVLATLASSGSTITITNGSGTINLEAANNGTVTSVGLGLPAEFTVTGSPVTTSGTLTGAWNNQAANTVLAGPTTGAATTPTFRALVSADVPNPSLTATYVGYGSAGGALTGTANYTWTTASNLLTLGAAAGTATITAADGSTSAGAALILTGGDGAGTNQDGGNITLTPGAPTGTGTRGSLVLDYSTFPAVDASGVLTSDGLGGLTWGTPAGTYTWTLTGSTGTQTISSGTTVTLNPGTTGLTYTVAAGVGITTGGTLEVSHGGTGLSTTPIAGQLLIGNTSNADYDLATLTAGTNISITNADGAITIDSTDQYTGTVTSVATSSGTFVDVTGGTITSSGTITGDLSATGTPSATTFLRGDNTWGTPVGSFTFDVTGSSGTTETISSGDTLTIAQGTGITAVSSNPDTVTITNTGVTSIVAGTNISVSGATGAVTINSTDQFTGTVTSVGLGLPAEFSVSGSPVTTSGTLTGAWTTQTANTVFAGPTTGAAATPAFRALVPADVPNPSLTATYVGYGSGGGALTGISTFTFDDTAGAEVLTIGTATTGTAKITSVDGSGANRGSNLDIFSGDGGTNAIKSGVIRIISGEGGSTSGDSGDVYLESGQTTSNSDISGSITIRSGANVDGRGDTGNVVIATRDLTGGGTAGNISLIPGNTVAGTDGSLILDYSTYPATDSSGVLTSDGAGTLSWGTGANALTNTYVGYGDGSNLLTGTSNYTWNNALGLLSLQGSGSAAATILGPNGVGAVPGTTLGILAGSGTGTNSSGGAVNLTPGNSTGTGTAGSVTIRSGQSAGTGDSGSISLLPANSAGAGADGKLILDYATWPDAVGGAGEVLTTDALGNLSWTAASGSMNDFIISDGVTTQTISDGDTITFTAGTGITAAVSATDTLTITNTLPFNNLTLAGDSGPSQTITDGNTITVAGGTGISSVASATDTVTLNLDNTAVTAGSYTNSSITVDAQGRLTAASSGSSLSPGGANTNVQFNNAGSFDGDANFTWTTGTGSLIVNDLELTNATGTGAYTITGQSNNITLSDNLGGTIIIADAVPASAVTPSIVNILPDNIIAGSHITLLRNTTTTVGTNGPYLSVFTGVQSLQEAMVTVLNRTDEGAGTLELVSGFKKTAPTMVYGATLTFTDGAETIEDPLGPVSFFARKRDYNLGTPPIWTGLQESKKMALGSYSTTINSGGGGAVNSKEGIIDPIQESFTVDSQNYGATFETTAQAALNYQLPHNAYKRQEVLHIDESDFDYQSPGRYEFQLTYKDHAGLLIIFQNTGTITPTPAFLINMPDATESNVGDTYWLMSIYGTITPSVKIDPGSGVLSTINGGAGTSITAYQCQRIIAATNGSQPVLSAPGTAASMSWVTMATNT